MDTGKTVLVVGAVVLGTALLFKKGGGGGGGGDDNPAFSLGAPFGAGVRDNPMGTADLIPFFSVNIMNNATVLATHMITVMCDYYVQNSSEILWTQPLLDFELTLVGGQSRQYDYDAYNEWQQGRSSILVSIYNNYADFWIKDELGNASSKIRIP